MLQPIHLDASAVASSVVYSFIGSIVKLLLLSFLGIDMLFKGLREGKIYHLSSLYSFSIAIGASVILIIPTLMNPPITGSDSKTVTLTP